jgi:putative FmdB family regulatory protein
MKEDAMPLYDYECKECQKVFTAALTLREHASKEAACPGCGSKNLEQLISGFIAKTDRKS